MVETKNDIAGPKKPSLVKEMIDRAYSGSKLEIFSDGWQIWDPQEPVANTQYQNEHRIY